MGTQKAHLRLEAKFFWILLIGVAVFFGLLTFLIIRRETYLMMDIHLRSSEEMAHSLASNIEHSMLSENPEMVSRELRNLQRNIRSEIGVLDNSGAPAFKTRMIAPRGSFDKTKESSFRSGDMLVFIKPLANAKGCQSCHNPNEKTRGTIIIKTPLDAAISEIKGTEKRLILYGITLGILSELFLIVLLQKLIIKPVEKLQRGAQSIKRGNLSYRVDLKSSDELGYLAGAFNEMAETIENAQTYLEETLQEKTTDLRTIAELSTSVFKGDISVDSIVQQFADAITDRMGYSHASVCMINEETGLLFHTYKKGTDRSFCEIQIPITSDHPFARVVRKAKPITVKSIDIGLPGDINNIAIIPILSHQRKSCKEIQQCIYDKCPAYDSLDERCWLIEDTMCRSPIAVAGSEKIYGCVHCKAFPVLGVLMAGRESDIDETALNSLEILTSEIASALENEKFIRGKQSDIQDLVKLHDLFVEKTLQLDIHLLCQSIASYAVDFADIDAAIVWLSGTGDKLNYEASVNVEVEAIPKSISLTESLPGNSISENRLVESAKVSDGQCLSDVIHKHDFLYMASIPMKLRETVFGSITLFKRKDFFMSESEKAVILLFASQSAAAINTASLYGEVKRQIEFSDAIFNNMSMGIIVLDPLGSIVRYNQAAEDILRIHKSTILIGTSLLDEIPETVAFLEPSVSSAELEINIHGDKLPIGYTVSPLLDESNQLSGTIIVFRDLTEIKKLRTEIRKKHHFESMGKVVAGVAHEIRNPLFGISSIAQILNREIASEQHNALLEAMLKEIYRMKQLVDELLLYTRPSNLSITDLDLNEFMDKISEFAKQKNGGVSFSIDIPEKLAVRADMNKLIQVFRNLADNSIIAGATSITVSARQDNGNVMISLSDNGDGIEEKDLERIFDPFFTTRKEGTGLGLSICKKLIEDHGGVLEVSSRRGEGTTVEIKLKA